MHRRADRDHVPHFVGQTGHVLAGQAHDGGL